MYSTLHFEPKLHMPSDSSKCVLNIRKFPTDLRKRLRMRALDKGVSLGDLVAGYLRAALDKEEQPRADKPKRPASKKVPLRDDSR